MNRELLTMRNAGKEGEGSARVDVGCELENQSCGARRTDGRREVGAAKRRLPARARARVAVASSPRPPLPPIHLRLFRRARQSELVGEFSRGDSVCNL